MIDDKKIESAANKHIETEYARYNSGEVEEEMICLMGKDSFKEGVKWTINELLKDLWNPSSEEPKNLEYIVFTTTMFGEVYLFTKQVDNTQDWKTIVETHGIEQWIYRDDIVSLIFKEVKE